MTELSGTLEGVGLPALLRFLTGLKKSGCLRIDQAGWHGEIVFEAGQLTGASLGSRNGLVALDALVQVLPSGRFTFDTSIPGSSAPTLEMSPEALHTHLDELVARIANGTPSLPSVDAVPELVALEEEASGAGDDPLPLDRATLQTLLMVDGQRTVREIVALRGSFDALWQLARLAEVGLVRLPSSGLPPAPVAPRGDAPPVERPSLDAGAPVVEAPDPTSHCPKLGFEDDPGNSFSRPTRLHRCFAAGSPLPLSLDQQRELCLSDQFSTCPRLNMVGRGAPRPAMREFGTPPTATDFAGNAAIARAEELPAEPEADDPRIVRLPRTGRNNGASPGGVSDAQRDSSPEPPELRSALHESDPPRPTPLLARVEHARRLAAALDIDAENPSEAADVAATPLAMRDPHLPPTLVRGLLADQTTLSRLVAPPVPLIAGVSAALIGLAVLGYLFVPQIGNLFADDSVDLSGLPNASAVAAGTSVAQLAARRTPVALITPRDASAASALDAPVAPTLVPAAAPATVEPTPAALRQAPVVRQPVVSASPAALGASGSPVAIQARGGGSAQLPAPVTLLDEKFADNAHNWASDPEGTAWLTGGSYRLTARQAGQFVALGAPMANVPPDVIVSATFRKLGGAPGGGGFGIILRDQGPSTRDGTSQSGQYYAFEVGDRGEVGIWRRDTDHWVDLVPWQHTDTVHAGTATNELTVSAVGNRLSLSVNGTQVVTRTDTTFTSGGVGLLVGGDGNQVAVDHFTVQTP